MDTLIGELSAHGVFSRTADGVIFSRHMVGDEEAFAEGRKHSAKRWSKPRYPKADGMFSC
jgi:hypothetical protein